jgi:hypothetical protein
MYKKINQNFIKKDFTSWESLKGKNLMSQYVSKHTTLSYYNINDIEYFKTIHTGKFFTIKPDRVRFSILTGQGMLSPHKDHDATTVLNYYISAEGDQTIFYNVNEFAEPFSYKEGYAKNIYNQSDLTETTKFIAVSGDAYLLDVSNIHSVYKKSTVPRVFISYIWMNNSFETISNNLTQT